MNAEMEFDTREMERAMVEISRESDRTDFEIVTANSDTLVRSLAYNTPRKTGSLRAGFWPAWNALDKTGSPGTRRPFAPYSPQKSKDVYVPDGGVQDDRRARDEKSFEFVNRTHILRNGKKIYYGYVLNARSNFWGKGEREATFKFGRAYEKMLKRHNKI